MSLILKSSRFISVHRRPVALLGAVVFAFLLSSGVSMARHGHLSFSAKLLKPATTAKVVTVDESIPFELQQDNDSSMTSGQQFVRSQGAMGLREETFRVTYLNGQEIHRVLLSNRVLREASPRVVLVGTGSGTADQTASTGVSQNNSDVSVNSTGNCHIKTSGDIGDRDLESSSGSYHFSNSSSSGSSNNSISVNCTSH